MKTIVISDIHGRSIWKLITHLEKPERVVFIGDYFDSFIFSAEEQLKNFKEIIEYKNRGNVEVILLIGNHDMYMCPAMMQIHTKGYQSGAAENIMRILQENKQHLKMAFAQGNFLFTHAGVSNTWLVDINDYDDDFSATSIAGFINLVWKHRHLRFKFNRVFDSEGDDVCQTPIWIRPRSLMLDAKPLSDAGIIQVVGHTIVDNVTDMNSNGKYWFTDTLGVSGEYMVIENNEIKVKSTR